MEGGIFMTPEKAVKESISILSEIKNSHLLENTHMQDRIERFLSNFEETGDE